VGSIKAIPDAATPGPSPWGGCLIELLSKFWAVMIYVRKQCYQQDQLHAMKHFHFAYTMHLLAAEPDVMG
jgi:hypothetical protein